jgi:S-layer family protein
MVCRIIRAFTGFALVLSAGRLAAASGPAAAAADLPEYGTTNVSYVRVPGIELFPVLSAWGYDTVENQRYSTNGIVLTAPLHLPDGARVVSMKFEFYDGDPGEYVLASLVACDIENVCVHHPEAGAGPEDCAFPGWICSGIAFQSEESHSVTADLTVDDVAVRNLLASYFIEFQQSEPGSQLRIAGVVVGYVLQVSPAPATPTFNDVPATHPFFQFIEALAASGITGGCGNGNYCPDAPLTRGQMAVFLAKALGL